MPMKSLIVIAAAAMLAMLSPAFASTPTPPVLELTAGEDPPSLAPYIRYTKLFDDVGSISPDRILAAPLARIEGQSIHFGPPGDKIAVVLKVRNVGAAQGSWILTTGRGTLNHFRLYEAAGEGFRLLVDGTDAQSARENLGTYQAFSTELVLDSGQEKLILIEFRSENSTYLPLEISTYGTFFKERRANIAMVSGVVFGALVLLLLNFLFFSITGHREFAWLAVAQAFFALNTVHAEGYVTIFFLPDKPMLGIAIEDVVKCAFAGAMAQFGRSFVRTRINFPKRDRALKILIVAAMAIIALQAGLFLYPPEMRSALHIGGWLVAVGTALFLPFVGYAAMKQLGYQLWPLFVGWASLALFIVYAAIASMGLFTWLPINWHLAGPVGLFESLMVTLALGLNLKKIQNDKLAADTNYARSLTERLQISERAARLAEEKAFALATVNSQNALLHASGHDSKQVILALNSAIDVLKRDDRAVHGELTEMLQSSADYLGEIISTTMSGANIVGSDSDFLALGSFGGRALVEPLTMMFKTPFADKKLTLKSRIVGDVTILSDKPLLMRAIANLLSNAYKYTDSGGATIGLERRDDGCALITIADTGIGMDRDTVDALNADAATRLRVDESIPGTGSGFLAARRLVETLSGSLRIMSSSAAGTRVRIVLPAAFQTVTPCSAEELQAGLPGWRILDFDRRETFDAALAAADRAGERAIALSYDDTTVTRGRLSEMVAMMMIKPACIELREHPLLRAAAGPSEEV